MKSNNNNIIILFGHTDITNRQTSIHQQCIVVRNDVIDNMQSCVLNLTYVPLKYS